MGKRQFLEELSKLKGIRSLDVFNIVMTFRDYIGKIIQALFICAFNEDSELYASFYFMRIDQIITEILDIQEKKEKM